MGSFVEGPNPGLLVLKLEPWEEIQRKASITAKGSPSPIPYAPIHPVPSIYTHVGHAAQYGIGRRNGRTIRMIILHITDVDGSALGAASYDARRSDLVSANAFVGPKGEIVLDVAEENRAFTTGRWIDESLAAEIVGHDEWSPSQWRARPLQMEGITRLLVWWCKEYNIPVSWLSPAEVAEGASRLGTPPVQGIQRGITDHKDANLAARLLGASIASTTHICVGPGLRTVLHEDIFPEVRRRLNQQPTPPQPNPTPTPIPPITPVDPEDEMFLISNKGQTAVVYGGLMTGLAGGSELEAFVKKCGPAIPVSDATWNDFMIKSQKLTRDL